MQVRKYQQADRQQLINLWLAVFPEDPPHNKPAKLIEEKTRVDDLIFVLEESDQLIGACMAGYDGHRGWLYAVAVLPQFRRRGCGELLVSTAVEELKNIGCPKVNLQIRSTNREVAAFYKSLGFEVEQRISMGRHI